LLLAAVQIQKDLIGRENKLGIIKGTLVHNKGLPQDLDRYRALVILRKGLKRRAQLLSGPGHGTSVAKAQLQVKQDKETAPVTGHSL
jgi:hypothetical protein